MDKDSYSEEHELKAIKEWPHSDPRGLLGYVKERWKYPEYWKEEKEIGFDTYYISTAGWSGNEELIGAMVENVMFWTCYWQSSKRGGHYEFQVR